MISIFSNYIQANKLKIITSLAVLSSCLLPDLAMGQVKVSPMVIESKVQRGQSQDFISITNITNKPSRVRVYAEPFVYDRDSGLKTLPANTPGSLVPYMQFSPREMVIQPGQTRRVRVLNRLAPNLPDGEYRAVVFHETLDKQEQGQGRTVNFITKIGVAVYARKGNISPNVAIESASYNSQKRRVQLLVNNTGNASALIKSRWELKRDGKEIKKGESDSTSVSPSSQRNLTIHSLGKNDSNLPAGNYQLTGKLFWGENNKNEQSFSVNFTVPAATQKKPVRTRLRR